MKIAACQRREPGCPAVAASSDIQYGGNFFFFFYIYYLRHAGGEEAVIKYAAITP